MPASRILRSPVLWLVLATSVPFAIGFVQVLHDAQTPFFVFGDQALIDLSVRRSLDFMQFTGPYSRFGWAHPGPLYFYFIAPGTLISHTGLGIYLGAIISNWFFAAVGTAIVARSTTFRTAAAATTVVLGFLFALGPFALRDPWNPEIVVIPLLAAALVIGAKPTVTASVFAAVALSLSLQAHFGTVSVVASVILTALVVHLIGAAVPSAGWLRGGEDRRWVPRLRSVLVVGVVTVVAWLLPIIEQLQHGREGNFGRVVHFNLTNDSAARHSLKEAAQSVIGVSWLPNAPALIPPTAPPGSIWAWFAGWLVLAAVGMFFAWRLRQRLPFVLCTLSGLGLIVATVAVSRIVGTIYVYLLWWVPIPAVALLMGWAAIIFGGRAEVGSRVRVGRLAKAGTVFVTVALLGATGANAALTLVQSPLNRFDRSEIGALADKIVAVTNAVGPGPVELVLPDPDVAAYVNGVVATLASDGRPVSVEGAQSKDLESKGSNRSPVARFVIARTGSGGDTGGQVLLVTNTAPSITLREITVYLPPLSTGGGGS